MTWYLATKKALHKMHGAESVERIRSWPSVFPLSTAKLAPHNLIVNLECEEPPFASIMLPGNTAKKRSQACDALVRRWEGYHKALPDGSCAAYADVAHGWDVATIGYGTTFYSRAGLAKYGRKEVKQGDVLTREEAESELDAELDICEAALLQAITAPITQSMLDALISFAFNLGIGGSKAQIDRVNAGKYEECARAFDLYINANGRPFQGLINRRNDEEALFRSEAFPVTAAEPEPTPKPSGAIARITAVGEEMHTGAWAGLRKLRLVVGDKTFLVASGARGCQEFRRPTDKRSFPGNLEPIPQGFYSIADISWANGKDSYEGTHGSGLGPVWVGLDADFSDDRGAFGFHLDSNIGGSPGSAGCVVFRDIADLKRFVAALREFDPKSLNVDWGLA